MSDGAILPAFPIMFQCLIVLYMIPNNTDCLVCYGASCVSPNHAMQFIQSIHLFGFNGTYTNRMTIYEFLALRHYGILVHIFSLCCVNFLFGNLSDFSISGGQSGPSLPKFSLFPFFHYHDIL